MKHPVFPFLFLCFWAARAWEIHMTVFIEHPVITFWERKKKKCYCNVRLRMCCSVHKGQATGPRMWKEYETIKALWREFSSGKLFGSGTAGDPNNEALWAGEQISVRCITYHEQAQMSHSTDTLDTLDIYKRHESSEGQLNAFRSGVGQGNFYYHPRFSDLDQLSCLRFRLT